MVRPSRNDRTLKLRALSDELANAEWPDDELTQPVIHVNIPPSSEKPGAIERNADAIGRNVERLKNWQQVAVVAIVAAVAVVYLITR